jgi:uncharacterized protein (TIGR03067 family)
VIAVEYFAAGAPTDDLAQKDIEKFQGTWQAVSAEADGQKLPAEALEGFEMVVEGHKVSFNPRTENRQSSFEIDLAKAPKQIIVTPLDGPRKGHTLRGLYSFEGGQLKLLINNDPNGKGEAPAEFSTRRGDGLRFLILKPASPQADDEK